MSINTYHISLKSFKNCINITLEIQKEVLRLKKTTVSKATSLIDTVVYFIWKKRDVQ